MRILVTAGPTREHLDPVRYLTNRSTGTLGYAVASAARGRGHEVLLVSGPVALAPPEGVDVVNVTSADDLASAALGVLDSVDAVVMTAAVADFTFQVRREHKLKKRSGEINLTLVPTTDVLAEIGRRRRDGQVVMGFCLETENGEAEARRKLAEKNCDLIVLNSPANFGDVSADVTVFTREGDAIPLPGLSKAALAGRLLDLIEQRARAAIP